MTNDDQPRDRVHRELAEPADAGGAAVRFRPELVDPSAFLAPSATVLGEVVIAADASIWFGSVIRGDTAPIEVGQGSNIQDLCVLHADEGFPCRIGSRVTVGHAAIVHGAEVADDVMIGMRAVVMNGAVIGSGSIVAPGAVITENTRIPPGSVVMGTPGRVKRAAEPRDQARIRHAAEHYIGLARRYRAHG